MKALVYEAPGRASVKELARPSIGESDALDQNAGCGHLSF